MSISEILSFNRPFHFCFFKTRVFFFFKIQVKVLTYSGLAKSTKCQSLILCVREDQDFKPFHMVWNIMSVFISNSAGGFYQGMHENRCLVTTDHLAFLISFKDDKYSCSSLSRGYNPPGSHKVTVFLVTASGDKLFAQNTSTWHFFFFITLVKVAISLIVKEEAFSWHLYNWIRRTNEYKV